MGWSIEDDEELHTDQRKLLPVVIAYVIAILIGLLLPVAAVALYFGLAVYLVVPFREARPAGVPALIALSAAAGAVPREP